MKLFRNFGSDPEFFIVNNSGSKIKDEEFGNIPIIIPPAALITDMGASFTMSKNGKRVLYDTDEYRFIEDGCAIELNIKSPIESSSAFNLTISRARTALRGLLSKYSLTFSEEVLGYFNLDKYVKGRDESFLDCIRFGCDRDYFPKLYILNGFEEEECKTIDASKHSYRYAGGHIHIQNMSDNPDIYSDNQELASIILDFIVGTRNILFDRQPNIIKQELGRLKYYGHPGRIRIQKYSRGKNGIEYRPPSNQWITNSYFVENMFQAANLAATIVEKNGAEKFFDTFKDRIFDMWEALMTHNKDLSKILLGNALEWSIENGYTDLGGVKDVIGNL